MFLNPRNSNPLHAEYPPSSAHLQSCMVQFAVLMLSFFCKTSTFLLQVFSGKPVLFVLDKNRAREFFHELRSFILHRQYRVQAGASAVASSAIFFIPFISVSPHSAEVYLG